VSDPYPIEDIPVPSDEETTRPPVDEDVPEQASNDDDLNWLD